MAQINKIQSFKSFSEIIAQEKAIKETQVNATKRGQLSSKISALLDEMNITSFEGLDQKVKEEFIKKVFGEVAEKQSEEIMEGTRSQFGKIDKAGNITSVYIHYDGYPENMLPIIQKGYKSGKGVDTVIAGGSAASLEKDPSSMDYYGDNRLLKGSIKRINKYLKDANDNSSAEYVYLWDESTNQWMMADLYSDKKLMPITESMLNEKLSTEQKMVETFLKKIAKEFDYSIQDAARFVKDTISKMGLNESMNEEIDIYDRLGDLMNNLNTEIGNLKGSTKDTQWLKQLDLIQSALEKLEDRVSIATKKLGVIPESMNKEGDDAEVNEGIGTIALGIMLAWVGLKVIGAVAKQVLGKIGANVEIAPEQLKQITNDLVLRVAKETGSGQSVLLSTFLKRELDKKIDSGEIKTVNALEKAMKEYLSANESAMNEAASYDPDDIFFLWDDIVDNDREGIEKGYTKVGSKKAEQFNFDTDAPNFDKFRRELVALLKKNGWKHDIIGNDYSGLNIYESAMNEAEVKSDEEFKEYAFAVLKKAFGEEFDEAKAQEVIDGILGKVDGDYGAAVGMLTSSLG